MPYFIPPRSLPPLIIPRRSSFCTRNTHNFGGVSDLPLHPSLQHIGVSEHSVDGRLRREILRQQSEERSVFYTDLETELDSSAFSNVVEHDSNNHYELGRILRQASDESCLFNENDGRDSRSFSDSHSVEQDQNPNNHYAPGIMLRQSSDEASLFDENTERESRHFSDSTSVEYRQNNNDDSNSCDSRIFRQVSEDSSLFVMNIRGQDGPNVDSVGRNLRNSQSNFLSKVLQQSSNESSVFNAHIQRKLETSTCFDEDTENYF